MPLSREYEVLLTFVAAPEIVVFGVKPSAERGFIGPFFAIVQDAELWAYDGAITTDVD